jgi:hypothetical protein
MGGKSVLPASAGLMLFFFNMAAGYFKRLVM